MAGAFCKIRARLGATRLVLAEAAPTSRDVHSKLQSAVVADMMAKSLKMLEPDQKASLAAMVSTVKFSEADEKSLLQIITGSVNSTSTRRKSQDFVAFIWYLCGDDWRRFKDAGCDGVFELCIEILIMRFYCVNPDEYTLKRIACLAMVLSGLHFDLNAKKAVLKKVKERFFKLKRKFNLAIKKRPDLAGTYIEKLPSSPKEFERMYPQDIARFKVEGNWVSPEIDVSAIYRIEVTLGCRGLDEAKSSHEMVAMDSNNANCNTAMFLQLIRDLARRQDRDELGCNLTFPPKRKRQLEETAHEAWAKRRPKVITDFDGVLNDDEPKIEPVDSQDEPKIAPVLCDKDEPKIAPAETDNKERVGVLLDAMMERDREKALAAKEKAAQAKADKKANDAALKAANDALLHAGGSHTSAVLKAKASPKASPKQSPKPAGASPKATPKAKPPKKEGVELEQSRNQYLARTNIGSKSFRFGPGFAYNSPEKAKKEAMKWFERNKTG